MNLLKINALTSLSAARALENMAISQTFKTAGYPDPTPLREAANNAIVVLALVHDRHANGLPMSDSLAQLAKETADKLRAALDDPPK